jgi:hypothetical protein
MYWFIAVPGSPIAAPSHPLPAFAVVLAVLAVDVLPDLVPELSPESPFVYGDELSTTGEDGDGFAIVP